MVNRIPSQTQNPLVLVFFGITLVIAFGMAKTLAGEMSWLFPILVLMAILFCVMIARPIVGLVLVILFNFGFVVDFFGSTFGTTVRLAGIMFAGAFLIRVLHKRLPIKVISYLAKPLLIFLAWRLFQIWRTRAPEAAIWLKDPGSIPEFVLRLVMYITLYVLIINVCRSVKDLNKIVGAIIVTVALSAAYTFLVYYNLLPALYEGEIYVAYGDRYSGLRGDPNENATITVIAVGLVLPFVLSTWRARRTDSKLFAFLLGGRFRVYALLSLLIVSILLTGSRGGLICLLIVILVGLWQSRFRFWRYLPSIGLAVIFVLYVTPIGAKALEHLRLLPGIYELVFERSVLEVDTSAAKRFERMMISVDLFRRNPLFGAGFGNYELEMATLIGYGSTAHNLYAEILGEEGVVGLAIYLYLLIAVGRSLLGAMQSFRKEGNTWLQLMAQGLFLSFIAFNADRLFSNGDQLNKLIFFYIGLADTLASLATHHISTDQEETVDRNTIRVRPAFVQ